MAITINTDLSNPVYETYSIKKFNGVDYTTTPTNVEESRAVEISNYLPNGDALGKRNGYETLEKYDLPYGSKVLGIWKYKKTKILGYAHLNDNKVRISFIDVNNAKPLDNYILTELYKVEDAYLNVVNVNEYLLMLGSGAFMIYDGNDINEVDYFAYEPTYIINLGNTESSLTPVLLEDVNLANSSFKMELKVDMSKETQTFDLSPYFKSLKEPTIDSINGNSISSGTSNLIQFSHNDPYNENNVLLDFVYNSENYTLVVTHKGYDDMNFSDFPEGSKEVSGLFTLNLRCSYTNDSNGDDTKTFELKDIYACTQMCLYGVDKGDTLFIGGSPNFPNVDIHTAIPAYPTSPIHNYTYFPSSSYQAFGDASNAIIGYGILNNGNMIVIKESENNQPNVYSRTAQYVDQALTYNMQVPKIENGVIKLETVTQEKYYVDVRYPVFLTGCYVEATKKSKIIYYDNKVIISNKNGIYYISLNDSTATQTYGAYELSYSIRNTLKKAENTNTMAIYEDMLYVYREDKNGKNRVFVADKDRYRFIDSKLQYEWWALDGIEANNIFTLDDALYFSNIYGLYKFNENYIDDEVLNTKVGIQSGYEQNTIVNGENDGSYNHITISQTYKLYSDSKKVEDKIGYFKKLKEQTKVNFCNTESIICDMDYPYGYIYTQQGFYDNFGIGVGEQGDEIFIVSRQIYEVYTRSRNTYDDYPFIWWNNTLYVVSDSNLVVEDNGYIYYVLNVSYTLNVQEHPLDSIYWKSRGITDLSNSRICYITPSDLDWEILDVSSQSDYSIDLVNYIDGVWYDQHYNRIEEQVFNRFQIGLSMNDIGEIEWEGFTFSFGQAGSTNKNVVRECKFHSEKPIESYWYSNYNHLGHLEYLKTSDYLYFVPDAKRGGYTKVGYKSSKKDVGYMSYAVGDTFNFNDVDFEDFNFGVSEFGRTFSSKKKIKNFSFIQLKFYSNEPKDSTIAMVTFRFRYTKSNKGVR